MYLDLVLVRVAVHLAHSIPDGATPALDACLKCLKSSANVRVLIPLCKKNLYLGFFLGPQSFLYLCHILLVLLLKQIGN